jgi:hypothetical protein
MKIEGGGLPTFWIAIPVSSTNATTVSKPNVFDLLRGSVGFVA